MTFREGRAERGRAEQNLATTVPPGECPILCHQKYAYMRKQYGESIAIPVAMQDWVQLENADWRHLRPLFAHVVDHEVVQEDTGTLSESLKAWMD